MMNVWKGRCEVSGKTKKPTVMTAAEMNGRLLDLKDNMTMMVDNLRRYAEKADKPAQAEIYRHADELARAAQMVGNWAWEINKVPKK
jgi:hypothetical protein